MTRLSWLALVVAMAGCDETALNTARRTEYLHDDRTHLCFARLLGVTGAIAVPCNDAVKQLAGAPGVVDGGAK